MARKQTVARKIPGNHVDEFGRIWKGKRLLEHVRHSSNWALARTQNPFAYQIVIYPCDSETAHQIEAYIIEHRKPPFNVREEYRHLVPSLSTAVH